MGLKKVEFSFPDEEGASTEIDIEDSSSLELDEVVEVEEVEVEEEVAEEEDDLEVEIVDDTPEADRNRKKSAAPEEVTEEELKDYSDKVQKRIKHFNKGYNDERREKEAAQRQSSEMETYARRLMAENNELKNSVGKSQKTILEQAKVTIGNDLKVARKEYADAYEAGNGEALLTAQEKVTTAQMRATRLNEIKLNPLQEHTGEVQKEVTATPQPKATTKATEWAEENTWFGPDDEMTSFALGFHNKLQKSGMDVNSDEYYEKINSRMREVFPDNFEGTSIKEEPRKKRKSNVVASATRSASPKKVTLSQTQVAIAKRLGVPLKLYAQQVAEEMRKENG